MNIETVGIVGLGLLGRGIAACFLSHGFQVIGYTRRQQTHDTAQGYIEQAISDLIDRGNHPPSLANRWQDRYTPVTDFDLFSQCDLVIETVIEDIDVKREIFDQLEDVIRPDVPIASNTSALPISDLQQGRKHPHRFLGMHWSENAHATRFMEMIKGVQTSEELFEQVAHLAKRFGKEPAMLRRDVPAFICNRLAYAMYREAVYIVEMGVADIETVDRSCRNALGLWAAMCGPFRWMDITGGPAMYAKALGGVLPSLNNSTELSQTMKNMIETDAGGVTNGKGYYEYEDGDEQKWEHIFREAVWHVKQFQDKFFPLTENSK